MSKLNLKSFYYLSTTTCLKARFPFRQMCWFSCSLAFIFVSFIIISICHYVYYDQSIILVSFLEYKDLLGFWKYWSCCQHFPILELAFQYFEYSNRLFALVAQSSVMVFLFLPMVFLFTNLLYSLVVCSFFLFYLKIVCTQIRKNALNVLFSTILTFFRWLDYTNI